MRELMQLIDKQGTLYTDGLHVEITIRDVKRAYGNTRYVVTPVRGSGEVTVDSSRVIIYPEVD